MVDLENRLRYFVRNIVAVDKWPFRFGYSYRGGGVLRGSAGFCGVLRGKSPLEPGDVSGHCFSADLSTVTWDRENARVEIIFDVLYRWISDARKWLRLIFLRIFHTGL